MTTATTQLVNMTIDGLPVAVEKGTLLIRAAEQVGVRIPITKIGRASCRERV